ncbi:MAG: hypothetical protein V3U54_08820 [Thermodesulfobacteriota bacterium]
MSDIAVKYLEQAIVTYNSNKEVKFETHLYMHLRSGFQREVLKSKTRFKYMTLEHFDQTSLECFDKPSLDLLPDSSLTVDPNNDNQYDELIVGVQNGISEFGQQIFNLMINSDVVLDRYNHISTSRYKAKTLNANVISKILQKPRSSVHIEVKKIQDITKWVQGRLREGLAV